MFKISHVYLRSKAGNISSTQLRRQLATNLPGGGKSGGDDIKRSSLLGRVLKITLASGVLGVGLPLALHEGIKQYDQNKVISPQAVSYLESYVGFLNNGADTINNAFNTAMKQIKGDSQAHPEQDKQLEKSLMKNKQSTFAPPPIEEPSKMETQKKRQEERRKTQEEMLNKEKEEQAKLQAAKEKAREEEEKRKAAEEARLARLAKEEADRKEKEEKLKLAEEEAVKDNDTLTQIVNTVLDDFTSNGRAAIAAHEKAASAIKQHADKLRRALETSGETEGADGQWSEVIAASEAAVIAASEADNLRLITVKNLEKLDVIVLEGREKKETKDNESLKSAEISAKAIKKDLDKALDMFTQAQSEFSMVSEYRDLVRKAKGQFSKELESLHPELRLGQGWGGRLTDEELETLLTHAHARINQLQRQVAQLKAFDEERIAEAVKAENAKGERAAQQLVDIERRKLLDELEFEKEAWEEQEEKIREELLTSALARQENVHVQHLRNALEEQQEALEERFKMVLEDRLQQERDDFETRIAGSVARLRGIEKAVEARAELEKQGRKAQELWLACQSLRTSLNEGQEDVEGQRKPLNGDLSAIREASNEHPFVDAIIGAFPEESVSEGVWTEKALAERFKKVYRVSRRVALVDERGGGLLKYLLSYMQSILVVPYGKPLDENAEIKSETSQILLLDTARYYIRNGDLELAVRFVNRLKGAARMVASDWLREARLTCEAKQATDCLLAHASAAGLGSLF